jgi:hypothetical protein
LCSNAADGNAKFEQLAAEFPLFPDDALVGRRIRITGNDEPKTGTGVRF